MDKKQTTSQALKAMDHRSDIRIERSTENKTDVLDEIVKVLRRILDYCLCCLSCGCIKVPQENGSALMTEDYEMILLESEKKAVQNLLHYLEDESTDDPVLSEEHIRALSILTYSDNTELQRSAALCFVEISERMTSPLTIAMTRPLVKLLKLNDKQVQKSATLAVSNLALTGPESNKDVIVTCGAIDPLIRLLRSRSIDIQCNTCGCITSLATNDAKKQLIVSGNAVQPLLNLMMSQDVRVQRNASGAILNLTHLQSHRNELVSSGAVPVLVDMLNTTDNDLQYYCAASLSNIAVNEKHRALITAVGQNDAIRHLVRYLSSKSDKVKCQACFALRNLASDGENQELVVKFGALPRLHEILRSCAGDTLSMGVACLRNLSIHKVNEAAIVNGNFIVELCRIVCDCQNPEAQRHAAGILRNLAVGNHNRALIEQDCVEALTFVLLGLASRMSVLAEVTAALAVLADEDDVKYKLIHLQSGKVFSKLVTMASLSQQSEIQYNSVGTLGQIYLVEIPGDLKESNKEGIVLYTDRFLKSPDPNFIHLALWTLVQLLKDPFFLKAFQEHSIEPVIITLTTSGQPSAIVELANSVLKKLRGEEESTSSDD